MQAPGIRMQIGDDTDFGYRSPGEMLKRYEKVQERCCKLSAHHLFNAEKVTRKSDVKHTERYDNQDEKGWITDMACGCVSIFVLRAVWYFIHDLSLGLLVLIPVLKPISLSGF